MLPRFHRTFIVIFAVPYFCIQVALLYLAFTQQGLSWDGVSEAFIPLIGGISSSVAALHFYREYSQSDDPFYSTIKA